MGTRDGADDVKSVMHIRDPIAQRFVHRILERAGSRLNGADLRPEQLHAQHIWLLPFNVKGAHEYGAGQVEEGGHGGSGNAVLARTCFRDDPGLAPASGQKDWADAIIDLVLDGVIQFFTLEINLDWKSVE